MLFNFSSIDLPQQCQHVSICCFLRDIKIMQKWCQSIGMPLCIEFHSQNIYFLIKRIFYDFSLCSVEVSVEGWLNGRKAAVITSAALFEGGQKENVLRHTLVGRKRIEGRRNVARNLSSTLLCRRRNEKEASEVEKS